MKIILTQAKEVIKDDGSKMIFRPGEYNMDGDELLERLANQWISDRIAHLPGQEIEPEAEVDPEPDPDPDPDPELMLIDDDDEIILEE